MRRLQTVVITGTLAMAALVGGCAGQKPQEGGPLARTDTPIQEVKDLPKWVTEKGAAFSGERRVLYGVGNSAGLYNPALRRKAAEGQSRNDLAATLQVYVAGLQKQYLAETTANSMDKHSTEQHIQDTFKQVTEATLVGAQIVQYWENPLRNEAYALARLDIEQSMDIMKSYAAASGQFKELDANLREFVRKNADKAHDELNQELERRKHGAS